jgi:hypothetical protein
LKSKQNNNLVFEDRGKNWDFKNTGVFVSGNQEKVTAQETLIEFGTGKKN